jgi:hypothetical protein
MDDPPNWIILFVMGFITDIIYTMTIRFISQNKKCGAIIGNMLISLIGLVSTWIVINDQSWVDIFTFILGCGLGTYTIMSYKDVKRRFFQGPQKELVVAKKAIKKVKKAKR